MPNMDDNDFPHVDFDNYGHHESPDKQPENVGISYENTQSDNYDTNDYENLINVTYEKARRYKRKAKKLYKSLQELKQKYRTQNEKIAELEDENREMSEKMYIFSNRIDELHHAYNKISSYKANNDYSNEYNHQQRAYDRRQDPLLDEIIKENEFLKRENKRLSSYYLDTIERNRIDTESTLMIGPVREFSKLKQEINDKDEIIGNLECKNDKLSHNLKSTTKKYK